ncbi:MAG: T9SS type A sorting domain-containing protein, partial [Bacteroidota bacterium]|nr:T9SS type A sorting domain-containing protein [Bacteroidota bacterium]
MARGNYVLVVERRATIISSDTIFFKIWQMQQRDYQLEFITNNMDRPGMQGFLEDNYLKTSTPVDLNGSTIADFNINANPASADAYRFRIIFKSIAAGALPLTLTSIKATRQAANVRIDWKTENENNIKEYAVEKSNDANHFSAATHVKANNFSSNIYSWLDADTYSNATGGNIYYRIMTTETDGKVSRSGIVKLAGEKINAEIHIFPNPIVNNTIHLEITDQPVGNYIISILNSSGHAVYQSKFNHFGGNLSQTIRPNQNLIKGVYQVEVSTPTSEKITEKIVY